MKIYLHVFIILLILDLTEQNISAYKFHKHDPEQMDKTCILKMDL